MDDQPNLAPCQRLFQKFVMYVLTCVIQILYEITSCALFQIPIQNYAMLVFDYGYGIYKYVLFTQECI